jgi:prepilin-type N-terminal cleavage/methylation domain-containing protein
VGPRAGFTLLEVILVLAVLAVLAAAIMPLLDQSLQSTLEDRSRSELQAIYRAIVGDQKTSFGYVGDVGDYPASLRDLIVSPGVPGWKGPYLNGVVLENGALLDAYARPYEYYLVTDLPGADRLAVISGGPDRASTNTAATPNVAVSFTGTAPTEGAYAAQPGNADNQVFPEPVSANALDVSISSLFALAIQSFDSNPRVNAFVAGCPGLYQVTLTSLPRGVPDVLPYNVGFAVDLPQGAYDVSVTTGNTTSLLWSEKFTHVAGIPTTRMLNLPGLDSSATPTFTLTAQNLTAAQLEVYEFTEMIGSRLDPAQTRTYTVHGCAQVYVRNRSTDAVVDFFVMPHADFTRVIGSGLGTLTVTNVTVKDKVDVFVDGLYLGQVKKGKTRTFSGLTAGDRITFLNHKTGAAVRGPYTMAPGVNPPITI